MKFGLRCGRSAAIVSGLRTATAIAVMVNELYILALLFLLVSIGMDDPYSPASVDGEDHNAERGIFLVALLSAPAAIAFWFGLGALLCFLVEGEHHIAVPEAVMATMVFVLGLGLVYGIVTRRDTKYWFEMVCLFYMAAAGVLWLVWQLVGL